jgi:beta-lactamase regulating signal transducer with metallopeptidase domain
MSLTASVVILAVLVIRLFFARAPKIFSYVLWVIVLVRLLCPLSFHMDFSLLGLFGNAEYISNSFMYRTNPSGQFGTAGIENGAGAGSVLTAGEAVDSLNFMRLLLTVGTWVWVFGLVVMMAACMVSILRLHKKLKQAVPEGERIYRLPHMGTPFVYGLFRPGIYLPEHLEEEEKSYILLHEQIHIRRGDQIFRFLGYLALCIHWFNPLVWLAFWLSGRDMEMSCDEAVIRSMGSEVKKPYSMSLLEVASGSRGIAFRPIAFGEGDTKNRIKNILRYKKPARALVSAAIVVCVILALVLLANPREQDSDGVVSDALDAGENVSGETEQDETKELALGNIKEGDYKNAISDDELDDLLKTITEYYQKKLSWEIIDYRIADNDHSFYQLYKDYELGNIIVFEVHTTNNPSGLYRAIALGRKKDKTKWEVLNEGV